MTRPDRERRRDEAQRRGERGGPEAARPGSGPAADVLALQRSAGNRAVTGMLARDATKAPEDTATNTTSQLGELGVVPLDAVRWDPNGKEVHIVFVQSDIAPRFMQFFAEGKRLEPAWISSPMATSTLTGALIAEATLSQGSGGGKGLVSATLNFAKVDHDFVHP